MRLISTKKAKYIQYVIVFVTLFCFGFIFSKRQEAKKIDVNTSVSIPDRLFSAADMKPFDGTDDSKPIYIGLNGLVYDVSAGREFYKLNGPYHYLAGRDSSDELNLVGGGIIKTKYPVVGKIIK